MPPPLNHKKGFAWITISAVALTSFGAFAQIAVRATSVPFSFFGGFALCAAILLLVAPRARLRTLRAIPRVQWARAGFVMCSQLALFTYLADGTLLNGMLLYNTGPLFTPILAWLLWKKTIRVAGVVSIVLGFLGVALILDPTRTTLDRLMLLGLASGFFNSCSQVAFYAAGTDDHALGVADSLFQFLTLCAAACLIVLVLRPADLVRGAEHLAEVSILAVFVALAACILANQYARSIAYRNVRNPANLGPFLYLSIALSALVDWAVYDIAPSRLALPGGILVFASTVIVSWRTFHVGPSQQRSELMY